jgi:signal transduction histidine kinase
MGVGRRPLSSVQDKAFHRQMDLRRIKVLAVVASFGGLLGFELLRHFVVQPALGERSGHLAEHVVAGIFLGIAVVAFTFAIFRLLERVHSQLIALNEASLAVSADLSLDVVLGRVAELARSVAGASYASVSIIDEGRTVGSGELPADAVTESFPIVVRGRRLGELVLASPARPPWKASDRSALETFATNAGIAIENARLFAQVQDLVAARERARIGMDLHDGMIQELYAVGLKLDDARNVFDEDSGEAGRSFGEARESLRHVIGELRTYVYGLHDCESCVDLGPLIEGIGAEFASASTEVRVDAVPHVSIPLIQAAHLTHIVREAISNALRHSGASRVRVAASSTGASLVLEVDDDGRGFDPTAVAHGLGLEDMRARAALCGGRISVSSAPGRGTRVSLSSPLPEVEAVSGP